MPDDQNPPMEGNITIVLVDDHTMMREGTRRLLEEDAELQVIGEAEQGTEAVALCQHLRPRVVVLDIAMKGMNGFGVAQALLANQESKPEILVLTAYDQLAYVRAMLKLGARGYWLREASYNSAERPRGRSGAIQSRAGRPPAAAGGGRDGSPPRPGAADRARKGGLAPRRSGVAQHRHCPAPEHLSQNR